MTAKILNLTMNVSKVHKMTLRHPMMLPLTEHNSGATWVCISTYVCM